LAWLFACFVGCVVRATEQAKASWSEKAAVVEGSSSVRRWPHRRCDDGVEKPKINSRSSDAYLLSISGNLSKREVQQESEPAEHVPNPTQRYFQFYIHNNSLIPK
jgi:hypothetical protein